MPIYDITVSILDTLEITADSRESAIRDVSEISNGENSIKLTILEVFERPVITPRVSSSYVSLETLYSLRAADAESSSDYTPLNTSSRSTQSTCDRSYIRYRR